VLGAEAVECQYLCRILLADDQPVGISQTWLPRDLLGDHLDLFRPAVLETGSLYDLLQGPELRLCLDHGTETIRAGRATADEAGLLECPPDGSTLIVRRATYLQSGRAVESTVMTFAADRYEYVVNLFPPVS